MLVMLLLKNRTSKALRGYLKVSCCISLRIYLHQQHFCCVFLTEMHLDSRLCALKDESDWLHPPIHPNLCSLHSSASLLRKGVALPWACYCHRCCWALSPKKGHQCPKPEREVNSSVHWLWALGEGKGLNVISCGHPNKLGLWEQTLNIIVYVLLVTGADKPPKTIGKAAKPEIWAFTGV